MVNKELPHDADSLIELGWECFYRRDWNQLIPICEKVLTIDDLSTKDEAPCRKLFANALIGLSFENKENAKELRKQAIEHSRKCIELYGETADILDISESYDILGTSLQMYSLVIQQVDEKNRYFQEGLKAFEKAVSIDPNNKQAVEHLNRAKQTPLNQMTKNKSSGCFIATAIYGSYDSSEVLILREFRDKRLLTNVIGNIIVKVYYCISPPIAKYICNKPQIAKVLKEYIFEHIVNLISKRKGI